MRNNMGNIWVAAADNQTDVVQTLLDSGVAADAKDPNGYTPVHAAASYGHTDLLQLLVSKGGDINVQDNEGDTPLHHVEDVATAKLMVEQLHADWKLKNHDGLTPAQYIEQEDEFPELAQYLRGLAHGGDAPDGLLSNLPSAGTVDGHEIRYTMEPDQGEMSEEKRRQLEAIVNSDDPEAALRVLVASAVREGLANYESQSESQPDAKRSRES